ASVVEAAFMTVDAILSTLDDAEQRALQESDDTTATAIRNARRPCYELGRSVVRFNAATTQLTSKQLNTLPSFAFLLRRPAVQASDEARELLFMVLQKCTGYLGGSGSSQGDVNVREMRNVARRATAAMVRLAVAIPDSLMLIYADLSQLVQSRMADTEVADTVKSYLGEFQLALVAGASVGLAERKELARPIIRPLIESLNEFAPALQSPEAFMSMLLGLPALDQAYAHRSSVAAKQALDNARAARNRLTHVIATLHIYLNRTVGGAAASSSAQGLAPLWSDYVGDLVPPIMQLVQCVHGLWNPANWQHQPWQSAQARRSLFGLLEISNSERLAIIGVGDITTAQDDGPPQGTSEQRLDLETRAIYHALAVFREYAYKCLGKCARLPEMFQNESTTPEQFTRCLFADAESMSARHWRVLVTDVIRPVLEAVGNWPGLSTGGASVVAAFVPAWLAPLFSFSTQRLQTEWHELLARGAVLTSKEDIAAVALGNHSHTPGALDSGVSVADDIVHEKMLRDWTRAWSQLVADLLANMAEWLPEASQIEHELINSSQITTATATATATGSERNGAVGAFVLQSADTFGTTVSAALGALQYKDTQAVQRVVGALARMTAPLLLVALLPMYVPPSQPHAAIVSAYTARLDSSLVAVPEAGRGCSRLFMWLATDLIAALIGVLHDAALVDVQGAALGLLADLAYYSASIAARMPRSWTFRNASGSADPAGTDGQSAVGDPGRVLRCAMLETMIPALQAAGISSEEFEHALAQLTTSTPCDAKHRKAIVKVALQPMLAVEKSKLFDERSK
ncbi:karyopherin, partial [Coemansia sp. RSA 1933]